MVGCREQRLRARSRLGRLVTEVTQEAAAVAVEEAAVVAALRALALRLSHFRLPSHPQPRP